MKLTRNDFDLLVESLTYMKQHRESCTDHPNLDFKKAQIADVETLLSKIRTFRKQQDSDEN